MLAGELVVANYTNIRWVGVASLDTLLLDYTLIETTVRWVVIVVLALFFLINTW